METMTGLNGVKMYPRTEQGNDNDGVALDNLYPALVECFGIILLGYFAGRFNFISDTEAKGLGTFVGTFSLPALIFGSLCKLNLMSVNWTFLLAIFISKAILFFGVLIVNMVIAASRSQTLARSGIYAIFATQSNDFALGYPILKAIYEKSHPEYPMYLYLIAPISLVILNPIGFILMEISKARNDVNGSDVSIGGVSSNAATRLKSLSSISKGVATNPIIFMTVLGVIGSFIFRGELPDMLDGFLQTLGSAFSATALFLLGLRMVGKTTQTLAGSKIILPFILIALKTIVMPLVTRETVSLLHSGQNVSDTLDLANFGFLYGTFPTAPGVFVYAAKYNVAADMVASAMVMCTFLSAPIMFISARLLSIPNIDPSDYISELDNFLLDISIIGLLACVWVAFVLVISRKWNQVPHSVTLGLVGSQGCACLGAILWSVISCTHGWKLYLQYSIFAFGVYASRVNTAVLAVTLLLLKLKSPCFVRRIRPYIITAGYFFPAVLVLVMLLVVSQETEAHGSKKDPNFQYGETQAYVALIVLILTFLVTLISMIATQRIHEKERRRTAQVDEDRRRLLEDVSEEDDETFETNSSYNAINSVSVTSVEQEDSVITEEASRNSPVPIEDLIPAGSSSDSPCRRQCGARTGAGRYRCDSEHRAYCSSLLESYAVPPANEALQDLADHSHHEDEDDEFQLLRHTVLLLLLSFSMFVGIALCIWTLVMDGMSGIYLELVFLDGFLNFGQGLFSLAIFGLDAKYVLMPFIRLVRRLVYGQESLVLPKWEDVEEETKHHCRQFLKHHISNCVESIVRDVRHRLTNYKAAFRGSDLVDWLLEVDLARDRQDAVTYARHLVKGRVIRHVDNYLDFYDDNFLYTFKK